MNSKFLKLLTLTVGILALSAAFVSAEEKKGDGKCPNGPCEKEKPKAIVAGDEEKKDGKCPCEKEKPKAVVAGDEEKKDGKCPCEKEKPKA
ncbi:hypothetical protein EMGBS6_06180 [Opitutia bacterium]|nr:hypothetical protein EMGBS6_06180 [Opitutae bacterium]